MTQNEFIKLVASDLVLAKILHGFTSTLEVEMADSGIEIQPAWHLLGPEKGRDYMMKKIKVALNG
jgi:hypothetical protein